MMNAHVILLYQWLCFVAQQSQRPMAQLHYYTQLQLEQNPHWQPEHLTGTNPPAVSYADQPVGY